jgi:hypothetical protein
LHLGGRVAAVAGATIAEAATSTQKVTQKSVVTTLNDGSAAEQAFIFSGLAKGRDLTKRTSTRRCEYNT